VWRERRRRKEVVRIMVYRYVNYDP